MPRKSKSPSKAPRKKDEAAPEQIPEKAPKKAAKAVRDTSGNRDKLPVPTGIKIDSDFPIVGIGASAGGLEAFEQFFTHMPSDSGMAFVLIQHLDPTHKSILTELVRRYTKMKVVEATDAVPVQPNTVYVIPPNRYLAILHNRLHLLEPREQPGLRTPIDYFFRSLAEDRKDKAICIVMSGTGTEGALGLRAVKGEGGMGMVQDPVSAKYDGMPRNAIATGLADYIVAPDQMPAQLVAYVEHTTLKRAGKAPIIIPKEKNLLEKIFIIVRQETGHDFSEYKHNTILRRVDRRMAVNQIKRMSDYVRFLQEDRREAHILFKELLIGVTNFFRDREAFDALKQKVIPNIFEGRSVDQPVRIWVPGCSTGEEAYTIAILFREYMNSQKRRNNTQIFATDIDLDAIEVARQGLYPRSIAVDVAPKYLDRFFKKEDSFHRVKKEIRDMVVFALQNVITDPPFSKIDLISCRNLLIYLDTGLQKKVLPLFHYSLNTIGFLFLGSSETIGEFTDYFSVVDRKWKLFKRANAGAQDRCAPELIIPVSAPDRKIELYTQEPPRATKTNYRDIAETIILREYGPTAVIIDEKMNILFILGKAGKYLEPPTGEFTGNILAMAREGLKLELATAVRKSATQNVQVRSERLTVKTNGGEQTINLVVKPIQEPPSLKGTLMVIFEDLPAEETTQTEASQPAAQDVEHHPKVKQLQQELRSTKEYLHTTIEELETSNEELKSTNEELQSSNEELQSTNEELETSKEELQSVNEELTTVNSELQKKIDDYSKISSDLNNLLASTDIGTIFLDTNLNILRFTPAMTKFINLIQGDIGRPVSHIVSNIEYKELVDDAKEVLHSLTSKEVEVRTKDGRWYAMRILPYRTIENVIDGVVITFVEITRLKKALEDLQEALTREAQEQERRDQEINRLATEQSMMERRCLQSLADAFDQPLLVLDHDLKVQFANTLFCSTLNVGIDQVLDRSLNDLGDGDWASPKARESLRKVLSAGSVEEEFDIEHSFDRKRRVLKVAARRLGPAGDDKGRVLLIVKKISKTA